MIFLLQITQAKNAGVQTDVHQVCTCKTENDKRMEELANRIEKEHKIELEKVLKEKLERVSI